MSSPEGERRQASKGGFRTKRDASAYLTEQLARVSHGVWLPPSRLTLGQYLERWLARLGDLRPSTRASYEQLVRGWIVPGLGNLPLATLSVDAIKMFQADLVGATRLDGRGTISPRTAQYVSTVLRKALKDAVDGDLIPRSPAAKVKSTGGAAARDAGVDR